MSCDLPLGKQGCPPEGVSLEEEVGSLIRKLAQEAQSTPFHIGLVAVVDTLHLGLSVPELLGPLSQAGHNGTPAAAHRSHQAGTRCSLAFAPLAVQKATQAHEKVWI